MVLAWEFGRLGLEMGVGVRWHLFLYYDSMDYGKIRVASRGVISSIVEYGCL